MCCMSRAIAVLVLASVATAQDASQIDWKADLEKALAEAVARKAPVLLVINRGYENQRDRAAANRAMAETVYHDPAVVAASRSYVCLVAGEHRLPLDVGGDKDICRRFKQITYADLDRATEAVRARYFPAPDEFVAPQHLILSPDGKVVERHFLSRTAPELTTLLQDAMARFRGESPPLDPADEMSGVVRVLKSRDPAERQAAFGHALALLTQDHKQKRVFDATSRYLQSLKDYLAIRQAMEQISTAGTEGPLSLLLPYLKSSNPRLRRAVLDVLSQAVPYESFLRSIEARTRSEKQDGPLRSLVAVLDRYADVFKDAWSPLNRLLVHPRPTIKVLATFAAARPGNKPAERKFMARARKEANLWVRCAAVLALARMRVQDAVPVLQSVRKREIENETLVHAVDRALAVLGEKDASESVTDSLQDEIAWITREVLNAENDEESNQRNDTGRSGRGAAGRGR
jgi:hypothetical protein